jgi:YopX protein
MREIKFRAWDNVRDEMYFTGEEDNVSFSFNSTGIEAVDLREHDWGFQKLEHLIYMQYTGLKDKNGKEIYEGDILKDVKNQVGKVFWYRDRYVVEWVRGDEKEPGFYPYNSYLGLVLRFSEVIGNIYENPELLEGTI